MIEFEKSDQAYIAKRYKEGATLREIAEEYDVDPGTIRRQLALQGVKLRPVGRRKGH